MTLAAYTGHEALTFLDYIDAAAGRTLHAMPGGTYDVVPASGHPVPDLPAGWFAPLDAGPPQPPDETAADETPVPEPAPEPEPEPEQPQQQDETPTY